MYEHTLLKLPCCSFVYTSIIRGTPENPESIMVFLSVLLLLWVQKRGIHNNSNSCDPRGGIGRLAAGAISDPI